MLLGDYIDSAALIPERIYQTSKGEQRTCDWIVSEMDKLILIECKSAKFLKTTKSTGDPDDLQTEIDRILGKALEQLITTKRVIEVSQISGIKPPQSFLGIIVLYDRFLDMTGVFEHLIRASAKRLNSSITEEELNSLPFIVVPAHLLEHFCFLIPEVGLHGIFEKENWDRLEEASGDAETSIPPSLLKKEKEYMDKLVASVRPDVSDDTLRSL